MLIGQLTDIHLGFDPDDPAENNRRRLDAAIAALMRHRPDVVLATGDLTDRGDAESYRRLRAAFAAIGAPVLPAVGNHDDRAAFRAVFPEVAAPDGFVQYVAPHGGLRIVVLDTLDPGRHGGGFCAARAAWLADRLDEAPDTPTLIAMHHPPIAVGIDWMDPDPDAAWIGRFAAAIAGRPQVRAVVCGHLHRAIAAPWGGTTVAICAATAPQLALDLAPIDADAPDGRAMIVAAPPAYALHRWTGDALVSHFGTAGEEDAVLAGYDAAMQPLVRGLLAERAG